MTFEEDLTKRRIDVAAFAAGDPARYVAWKEMYAQMHPNSFYVSVKMVLNDVRRKFWLAEAVKPVVATTDAPAKPVTRRASIPGTGAIKPEAKPPVAAPTPEPTETLKPTVTPGKGRAVIPRATPVKAEIPDASESTPLPTDKPASEEAPKAPRARPVIHRPTPVTENTDTPTTNQEQIAQDNTNAAVPFHTNPNPEAEASPKPPRPRPVFKKPGAASPAEPSVAAETPDQSLPAVEGTLAPSTEETKAEVVKPPRPRPVIRRPNTTSEPLQPIVPPEATPPENNKQEETPASPIAEQPKTPRPRPVFKRPAKPDDLKE